MDTRGCLLPGRERRMVEFIYFLLDNTLTARSTIPPGLLCTVGFLGSGTCTDGIRRVSDKLRCISHRHLS